MKQLAFFLGFLIVTTGSFAQEIHKKDLAALKKKEDSLKIYAIQILMDTRDYKRIKADSAFTKILVRALKTPYSFSYPFDSLETISRLYAPDSSFRIFTWQLMISDNFTRQHGAIQFKTSDGSLKLLPLIDKSELIQNQEDTINNNQSWMGAVYYKIIETKDKITGKNYYTLFGYDENNRRSTKKILDVLTFNDEQQPVFGEDAYFAYVNDSAAKAPTHRYIMEFKKDAGPRLTFDTSMNMIVLEHLESESNEPTKKWTLIPDGDYEGFVWKDNRWVHIVKLFTTVTPEGQAPLPKPLDTNGGDLINDKLRGPAEIQSQQSLPPISAEPGNGAGTQPSDHNDSSY